MSAENVLTCRGDWKLGTACGKCAKCLASRPVGPAMRPEVDLADKESLVRLMFEVQNGTTSCRRAASEIMAAHAAARQDAARYKTSLGEEKVARAAVARLLDVSEYRLAQAQEQILRFKLWLVCMSTALEAVRPPREGGPG